MKIAVNAWFYESLHTGSGQYLRHLAEALRQLAPEIQLELVTSRKRDDLSKIKFEQSDFPRAAQRMKADLAFVPYWAPPLACAVPLVVTIHDIIPLVLPEYRGKAQHRLYQFGAGDLGQRGGYFDRLGTFSRRHHRAAGRAGGARDRHPAGGRRAV